MDLIIHYIVEYWFRIHEYLDCVLVEYNSLIFIGSQFHHRQSVS